MGVGGALCTLTVDATEEDIGSLRGCEPPDMCPGKQTLVLCKSNPYSKQLSHLPSPTRNNTLKSLLDYILKYKQTMCAKSTTSKVE